MTKHIKKLIQRSSHFLGRTLAKPAWDFRRFVADPRQQRGRRWSLSSLMEALLFGLLVNRSSLRGVESLTEMTGGAVGRTFARRVPDSTLYDLLGHLDPTGLRWQLQAQTHSLERSKSLEPVGLPCGVVAIDNKTLWVGKPEEARDPDCQVVHAGNRAPYAQLRVVRSVLISAAGQPALDQVVIGKETNEGGMFAEVFQTLTRQFPTLFEICSLDAGFCSLANAERVHQAGKAYLFGLKGNQPELWAEAQRLLAERTDPEVSTAWECYQGKKIRYRLYRSREMAGYLDWSHLEQVWRVEKQILEAGNLKVENRYYVTNLHHGRLKAEQTLRLVREHWGIEDHCYWSLDVIWDEDTKAWSTQGLAIQVLGLLRLMAYNLVGHLRCRYLRQRTEKRRWQEWLDLLFWVITQPAGACGNVAAAGT